MSSTAKERVLKHLCSQGTDELRNFKLFRGDATDVSAEDICEEVESTLVKIKNGLIKGTDGFSGDRGVEKVDLRSLV